MTRVFAVSDIHLDYDVNDQWLSGLSTSEYRNDILILAGDVSDSPTLLKQCFERLARRFAKVLYVPGNHELWVARNKTHATSIEKFEAVCGIAGEFGIMMSVLDHGPLSIVPLLGWYDYSFGPASEELRRIWMDYRACKWPDNMSNPDVARLFVDKNEALLETRNTTVISFSHFLPRIDVMPSYIPMAKRLWYPALGSTLLEAQIRRLNSTIHVYGHSHVNRCVTLDGTTYINNAFAYPSETNIAAKKLLCIYEC